MDCQRFVRRSHYILDSIRGEIFGHLFLWENSLPEKSGKYAKDQWVRLQMILKLLIKLTTLP